MVKKIFETAVSAVVFVTVAVVALKIFGALISVAVSIAMIIGAVVIIKKLVK